MTIIKNLHGDHNAYDDNRSHPRDGQYDDDHHGSRNDGNREGRGERSRVDTRIHTHSEDPHTQIDRNLLNTKWFSML